MLIEMEKDLHGWEMCVGQMVANYLISTAGFTDFIFLKKLSQQNEFFSLK